MSTGARDWLYEQDGPTILALIITSSLAVIAGVWYSISRQKQVMARLRRRTRLLTDLEVVEIQVGAPTFSETDLRRLFIRFMDLDADRSGTLTCAEFCKMGELRTNPLAYRLFDAFDLNEDGHMDFSEFINCIHVMSPEGTSNEKASAMFRIYDVDTDGKISKTDLSYILSIVTHRPKSKKELMSGVSLEETFEDVLQKEKDWDEFIGSVVDQVMEASSSDTYKNYLTFEDFAQSLAVTKADFREKMNIPFGRKETCQVRTKYGDGTF
jgi:serine/threonine-protein phosphatase 2B regulatory subunit